MNIRNRIQALEQRHQPEYQPWMIATPAADGIQVSGQGETIYFETLEALEASGIRYISALNPKGDPPGEL